MGKHYVKGIKVKRLLLGLGVLILLFGCLESPKQFLLVDADLNFVDLQDVPDSYLSAALKCVTVNSDENGLIFVTCSSGGGSRTYTGISPIIIDNDSNKISISSIVTKLVDGNNVSISCTGSDTNGICTINATAGAGGSTTDTTLDTNTAADLNWHGNRHTFSFSVGTAGQDEATIVIDPREEEGVPDYFISAIRDTGTVFYVTNSGGIFGSELSLDSDNGQIVLDSDGVSQTLQSSPASSSAVITLPPATTTLAGLSISQNFSGDQNFVQVNSIDVNVLGDLNTTGRLCIDSSCIDDWADVNGAGAAADSNYNSGFFVGLSSNNVPADLNFGGFEGYKAANFLCDNNFTGSHLCTTDEIISSIRTQPISGWTGSGWVAEGPPGYTVNANDCVGFTDTTATYLGAYWLFNSTRGGEGYLTSCSGTRQLTCCR